MYDQLNTTLFTKAPQIFLPILLETNANKASMLDEFVVQIVERYQSCNLHLNTTKKPQHTGHARTRWNVLNVSVRLPQGSPLPLSFTFFTSQDKCTHRHEKPIAAGFIDNIAILALGSSTHKPLRTLYKIHCQTNTWAATHAPVFDVAKYPLIHFRRSPFIGPEVPMKLDGYFLTATHDYRL